MSTTSYRRTRTDPDNYDDINLGSDSELGTNDDQSEVVVDSLGVVHYKDSPDNGTDSSVNGGQNKMDLNLSQHTYLAGGDVSGKSALEEEIDALLSDESDELLRAGGGGDVRLKTFGGEVGDENDDEFSVEQAIEQIGFGWFQIKMALLVSVLSMTDAGELMLLSMLSPALHCEWHLHRWQQALITTVVFCGYLASSPMWGKFADKFGRKKCLIMVGFWMFYFGILSSFSPNYIWMLVLRGITGMGIGGAAQNVVLYSEFLPARVRGFWLTLVSFSWIMGVVWVVAVAYFIMPAYGWRWLLVVAALPLLIFITCCYFLPESAYYHVACGNREAALEILQQVAKTNGKPMPLGTLKCGSGSGKFQDLFIDKKTGITTSLLLFIWFTMAFVYYGIVLLTTELFAKGHSCAASAVDSSANCYDSCVVLTKQDYANLMYTTLAEFPGTLLTLSIIDYVGRKKTMSIQYVFCGGSIFLLFICTEKKWLLTLFLFIARGLISGAFQGIYVYTPEVYPTHVRGIGLGTCGSIARIGCIVTPFVAQVLLGYSPHGVIGLYGGICFAAALAITLLPIETKGRKMISQLKEAKATVDKALHHDIT
ncbi:synaptic vesicle 2-related protein-like [Amphiura filiformis]|uniref:synaptic vesicle 2-related protein-like n=1 Tax=Amphiura filiformis TaxID=82378 RepID=UPI003B21DF3B